MSMLGFVYLVLIVGWIMIVLILKCKKSITPHFAFTDNYTRSSTETDRRPSVHVIELPADELDEMEQGMDAYHQRSNSLQRHSRRSQRSSLDEQQQQQQQQFGRTIETTYPTDAVINPAYTHDEEEYIINAPPPSYDEVMSRPDVYPMVHRSSKSSEANI